MRVVIEIVHPADVLFFKRPIERLLERGDDVQILSRHKDIACDLLDDFGFSHLPVSGAGAGKAALARELFMRDFKINRVVRNFRPNILVGFGGVAISHVGKLTGTPSISFYDSENASLQTRLTWPFISHLYVPKAYAGPTPEGRTTFLEGTKELSFLHPSAFKPDWQTALNAGLDPERDNFFVRIVQWRANHDIGKTGWTPELLRAVIARLSTRGAVHLSSESRIAEDLEPYRYCGPQTAVHHLIGHCRLLVGESATMASEAAVLGVPAIYAGRDFPGYVQELERAGLVQNIVDVNDASIAAAIEASLATPAAEIRSVRDAYVASCPDWAGVVVTAIDQHARAC